MMRVDVVGSGYESDGELEEDDAMASEEAMARLQVMTK